MHAYALDAKKKLTTNCFHTRLNSVPAFSGKLATRSLRYLFSSEFYAQMSFLHTISYYCVCFYRI